MAVVWTNEIVLQLIELYQNYGLLWDTSNPDYKHKMKKNDAWEEIANALKLPRRDVEAKVHTLRSQFMREKKKILSSKTTGRDNVKSSLWFAYDALKFLLSGATTYGGMDTLGIDEAEEEESRTSDKRAASPTAGGPSAPKRRRVPVTQQRQPPRHSLVHDPCASCAISSYLRKRDEAEILAKSWAIELEKMDEMQQLFAKKAINDILLQGRLGNLDQNSVQLNPPEAQTEAAWVDQEQYELAIEDSDSEHSIPEQKPDTRSLPGTSRDSI